MRLKRLAAMNPVVGFGDSQRGRFFCLAHVSLLHTTGPDLCCGSQFVVSGLGPSRLLDAVGYAAGNSVAALVLCQSNTYSHGQQVVLSIGARQLADGDKLPEAGRPDLNSASFRAPSLVIASRPISSRSAFSPYLPDVKDPAGGIDGSREVQAAA